MSRPTRPIADRFWESVEGGPSCWEWQGSVGTEGYGLIGFNSRLARTAVRAHRVSWELHFGPIPKGLLVCHHCDNRRCVRPDHLFLGTHKDNLHDALAKGRSTAARPGGGNPSAKLTDGAVREIRQLLAMGSSRVTVANLYGVTIGAITDVALGRTWRHVA